MFKIRLVDQEELQAVNELRDEVRKLHSMNAAPYQEHARLRAENEQRRQQAPSGTANNSGAEISALNAEIARLNTEIAALRSSSKPLDDSQLVRELRALFIKEMHPDGKGNRVEEVAREAIFQQYFQKVDAILNKYRRK